MSMNEIMAFDHERFGRVRGIEIDGESWLVGKDVAERLGVQQSPRCAGKARRT